MNQKKTVQQQIPKRILSSLISSVSAGVVPRAGAPFIAIGRRDEINAFLSDLEMINEGGGTMRFLIGRYGSGKSFLIQLIRGYALERDFLTADCDLSPERRLYGSGGAGVATYRELMKNLASKSSPDGGALQKIIAKWIFSIQEKTSDDIRDDPERCASALEMEIRRQLGEIEFLVGGYDFSRVIREYYISTVRGDENRAVACLRWLRGEYSAKTEARRELGFDVSTVIGDSNWYDFLKLWAALSHRMGYRGLLIFIDECVNLYKIPHRISRENNYEKILSMFNDTLQGRAPYLGLVLGGTPQFLEDTRRGLFSYEALRSRLCDSRFSVDGCRNLVGPVIRLARLSDDELLALIVRMTSLHAQNYGWEPRLSSDDQVEFLKSCLNRAGADSMITPREMLRDYMTVLNILMQNPEMTFSDIVNKNPSLTGQPESEKEVSVKSEQEKRNFDPDDIDF
ncbi:MAG: ATP-binding protein [Clostridia bacterium]|nr:ATP-binding protein [Clostridia bacterium]